MVQVGESENDRMLGWALAYAGRGFFVLPLWWVRPDGNCACGRPKGTGHKIGKHPIGSLVPHGSTQASGDPVLLKEWWSKYPDANIGLRLGETRNPDERLLAVDIDPRSDGPAEWYRYVDGRDLPMSVEARSGSGGSHLLYCVPKREKFPMKFLQGVELLCDGRYIVAPPSSHESGDQYKWVISPLEASFMPAPPWLLLDVRDRVAAASNESKEYASSGKKYVDGERNARLLRLRGAMMHHAMPVEAVYQALKIANETQCDPPLHESRVRQIAYSGDTTSKAKESESTEPNTPSNDNWPDGHPLSLAPLLAKEAIVGAQRLREIAAQPIPYIWQDIASSAQLVGLNGKPGGGKTTLAFLIVAARANLELPPIELLSRTMWPAREDKWLLLLEAEQSQGSTSRKLVRSFEAFGLGDRSLDRVIVLARREVIVGSPKWKEVQKMVEAGLISDVFIDTLARIAPSEANEEKDQAEVFAAFQQVIESVPTDDESEKPVFWIVMHARKGEDATSVDAVSGSAQRVAQLDTLINVVPERDGDRVVASNIHFTKLREEPDTPPDAQQLVVKRKGNDLSIVSGAQATGTPVEKAIHFLKLYGTLTKSKIRDLCKLNSETIEPVMDELFAKRLIESGQEIIKGRPRKVFWLTKITSGRASGSHTNGQTSDLPDDDNVK